jgi:hypothetical protein
MEAAVKLGESLMLKQGNLKARAWTNKAALFAGKNDDVQLSSLA